MINITGAGKNPWLYRFNIADPVIKSLFNRKPLNGS